MNPLRGRKPKTSKKEPEHFDAPFELDRIAGVSSYDDYILTGESPPQEKTRLTGEQLKQHLRQQRREAKANQ